MSRHIFLAPEGSAHPRWREAFPACEVLGCAPSAEFFQPADVVWVSAELPDALGALAALHQARPALAIVLLSLHPSEREALQGLEAGARGYCHAWATAGLLEQVALVVTNGGLWVGPELMSRVITATRSLLPEPSGHEPPALSRLTERERDVAREVGKGLTNKEIARELGITERTVKAHLGVIFGKLGIRDRLQLVLHLSAARERADLEG